MKPKALVAVGVTACIAATASADFIDFSGEVSDLGGGISAIDMYANFSDAGNVFLNIFNTTVVNGDGITSGGFYHDDFSSLSGGEGLIKAEEKTERRDSAAQAGAERGRRPAHRAETGPKNTGRGEATGKAPQRPSKAQRMGGQQMGGLNKFPGASVEAEPTR